MTGADFNRATTHFLEEYRGQSVNPDGMYGPQCMDLAEVFNQEVVHAPHLGGNAIDAPNNASRDFYDWILNTPDNHPTLGDLVVWHGPGFPYGHIAVCNWANADEFQSLDQNWVNSSENGSPAALVTHNYNGVWGWLRPKTHDDPAQAPAPVDPLPIPAAPVPQPGPVAPETPPKAPVPPDPTPIVFTPVTEPPAASQDLPLVPTTPVTPPTVLTKGDLPMIPMNIHVSKGVKVLLWSAGSTVLSAFLTWLVGHSGDFGYVAPVVNALAVALLSWLKTR